MSQEERKAIAIANSGKGLSRVQIAQRAYDKAVRNMEDCKRRLDEAIEAQGNSEEKKGKAKETAKKRALELLQQDIELQNQAKRILAELDRGLIPDDVLENAYNQA